MVRSWTTWWMLVAIGGAACGGNDVGSSGGSSGTTEDSGGDDDDGPISSSSSSSDGVDPDTSSSGGTTTTDTTSTTTDASTDTTAESSSSDTRPTSDTSSSDTSSSDTSSSDASSSSDSSSTSGDECGPADECVADEDCQPGQACFGCLCIGEPTGCDEYGDGVFADCTAGDNTVCENPLSACLVDNFPPTAGVCFFPCEEICDCPVPPPGFEDQLACADLTVDGAGDCYIDCAGGLPCPGGTFCVANTICMFGEEPSDIPPYGDCQNERGECDDGICLQGPDDYAVCATPCDDVGDCAPAPATGDAPVACVDLTLDMIGECFLDCSGGQTCPDGMTCDPDGIGICVWTEI